MDQVMVDGAGGPSRAAAMAAASDPRIIAMVRQGDAEAFDELYQRHLSVAVYVARSQTDNPSDADDVVAESFASIFQQLMEGKGPDEFFRSYLLTVVRRTAHDRNRKARRMPTSVDDSVLDSPVLDHDPVLSDLESGIMAKAFKSLPERWQAVLWHLDIEGLKPAAVAPFVGLSPNGVSSLAIRAREGLRQAYLQQHITRTVDEGCEEYASQLGKYARNALKRTSQEKVSAHLEGCAKCTALLIELNDVQGGMKAILFPVITGVTFTPGFLTAAGQGTHGPAVASSAGRPAPRRVQGIPAGRGSMGGAWKLTIAIVAAAMALVAALAWVLQQNAGSGAGNSNPAANSTTQSAAGKDAPPASAQDPNPGGETPGSSTSPSPGGSAASAPADSEKAPGTTAGGSAAVGGPPGSASRGGVVVVDSGTIVSAPEPKGSAGVSPSSSPVRADFSAGEAAESDQRELKVRFSLAGEMPPGPATVDFSFPDQTTFRAGATVPGGWTCDETERGIRCATGSLEPGDLEFAFGAVLSGPGEWGTLNYVFSGQNITSRSFTNQFN
ncbi:sigma-70 family RNA polymerase sigma factor [Paenarthrobacter ilicis]|uniref:sigma-70 family RNA polymerase sigma factor n=1 Tax=Paenarthrobacter ilicis TaxID=43665 RepID=UPI0028D0508A|nr:sigma-70 family RNA polymerase sigma factor [Paenarthrobacter ilicis]